MDSFSYQATDGIESSHVITVNVFVQGIAGLPGLAQHDTPVELFASNHEDHNASLRTATMDATAVGAAIAIDSAVPTASLSRSFGSLLVSADTRSPSPSSLSSNAATTAQASHHAAAETTHDTIVGHDRFRDIEAELLPSRERPNVASQTSATSSWQLHVPKIDTAQIHDELEQLFRQFGDEHNSLELLAGSSVLIAGSVTASLILWTTRSSYMMSVLSSSLPVWANVDPIPVLDADACRQRARMNTRLEGASRQSLIDIASGSLA